MDSTTNEGSIKISDWSSCKNILVIRADNLGDLIMSSPAIRALKESFGSKITVLTSQMATGIAKHIDEIDGVITYDLPWVKLNNTIASDSFFEVVQQIKEKQFDAAVIFTVFSQNPLPAAMLAYLANIPQRLAYCRENPYHLLTDWVPDREPYDFIQHQVERDLKLVEAIGAKTSNIKLSLHVANEAYSSAEPKIEDEGVELKNNWLIFHAGVSEEKRQFPVDRWIEAGIEMVQRGYQVLLTGTKGEKQRTDAIANDIGDGAYSIAGLLTLEEFIALIKKAPLVVSVNTGTVHIAAAVGTPIVVLYAATNPQHAPWEVPSKVLNFNVPPSMRSKNEVIQFLYKEVYKEEIEMPSASDIVNACLELIEQKGSSATQTLTPVTD